MCHQYYGSSIKYGLCATVYNASQLEKLETPALMSILLAMGINRHIMVAVRHGPKELGGVRFP